MRGMRAITIVLAIVLGRAAWGGPPAPEPAAPPPEPQDTAKSAPKVPPVDYLKAGARLFNKGDVAQAEKYFKAARRYRDDLKKHEQVVLDTYLEELEKYAAEAARPPSDAALAPASMTVTTPAPKAVGATPPARQAERPATASLRGLSRYEFTDPKQRARWTLQEARELIRLGKLDEADQKVADARAFDIKWGRLDDTPDKVAKAVEYARSNLPQNQRMPSARPLGIRRFDPAARPAAPGSPPDRSSKDPRS